MIFTHIPTMKASLLLPLLIASVVGLGGCTTTRTITVLPTGGLRPVDELGSQVLLSQKVSGVGVRLLAKRFSSDDKMLPAFYVGVVNGTTGALGYSPGNITAFSGDHPVRVYSYAELRNTLNRNADAAISSLEAQALTQEVGPQGDAYSVFLPGTQGSLDDHRLRTMYADQAAAERNHLAALIQSMRQSNLSRLLRDSTISPSGFAGGIVALHARDLRAGQPLRLVVTVGGETHEFLFDVRS